MATAPMTLGTVMLGEASRSQKRRILCDSAEMRSAEQMRRDRRGKGGGGEKRGRGVGVGRGRVSVRDEEKVQWLHGGNECPAV